MNDALNTIETEIVSMLKGNGAYAKDYNEISEVEIANIHQKFREDLRTYYDHELPAIGVMSFASDEVENNIDELDVKMQVVNMGGDLATLDAEIKTIVWQIIKMLKKQRPRRGGKCLQENAEDILNISSQIITGQIEDEDEETRLIVCLGEVSCTIQIMGD